MLLSAIPLGIEWGERMNRFVLSLLTLNLAACAAMPMNPEQFKQTASGASLGAVEQYAVRLPFNTVVANLQSATAQCLNFKTGAILSNHGFVSAPSQVTSDFRVLKSGQAQLVIQEDVKDAIYVGGKPNGGMYIFVADVTSIAPSSTNITMYYGRIGSSGLINIIKTWSSGSGKSCDDGIF